MRLDQVLTLYDYNYWANGKLLTAASEVSQEQYLSPGSFPYGGLRGTLVHTLDAEFSWRVLLSKAGKDFVELSVDDLQDEELKEADFPTLGALQGRWQIEEKLMRLYLAELDDRSLEGVIRYTVESGAKRERPLWLCLLHVVNHGTQHRSEAAALLTSFSRSPGDLDLTVFDNERKA